MPWKATTIASDSQNPSAPLFALHDTLTGEWYILDQDTWLEDQLWLDKPSDEFAFVCETCQQPPSKCRCEIGH